ncbi:MAG: hypothetical protein RMX96_28730 [Nostoc sp. ChiSLP02]|nr:hypothetical protein [Nostoc sp. DedSLP05]MDZ8097056.1 hypothetical protein [Nostoc sp. DedSLP01]MDZ8188825.1 hypothetical protein [Nostoc sp. ChiSLP02]
MSSLNGIQKRSHFDVEIAIAFSKNFYRWKKPSVFESLPYISLTSEAARRELLIAPILLDVVRYTCAQLRIDTKLRSEIVFLFPTPHSLLPAQVTIFDCNLV